MKFVDYQGMQTTPVKDEALAARLAHAARMVFLALKGNGYARFDLRMGSDGTLYMLDANPNPGFFYLPGNFGSGDFIVDASPDGHRAFLEHLIACAFRRREARRPVWKRTYHPLTGYGIVAAHDLAPGARIVIREDQPRRLASLSYIEKHWAEWEKAVFRQSGVAISENIFGLWSDNPDEWCPTNHSCEPNAVYDGLDIVAWKPIKAGEAITLEYATFSGPELGEFTCGAGRRAAAAWCAGMTPSRLGLKRATDDS